MGRPQVELARDAPPCSAVLTACAGAGLGLYPLGSLLNHSCEANAVQCFDGRHMQLRIIRPVQPGDELTVPYMDLAMTRMERRLCLAERYHFDVGPKMSSPWARTAALYPQQQ